MFSCSASKLPWKLARNCIFKSCAFMFVLFIIYSTFNFLLQYFHLYRSLKISRSRFSFFRARRTFCTLCSRFLMSMLEFPLRRNLSIGGLIRASFRLIFWQGSENFGIVTLRFSSLRQKSRNWNRMSSSASDIRVSTSTEEHTFFSYFRPQTDFKK